MKSLGKYTIALVSVGLSLVLTLSISPVREKSPYLLLTLGVMVSASQGWQAGVLATLLSAASAAYFLIPPLHSLAISGPEDLVPLLLFCIVGFSLTSITHLLRLSRDRVRTATAALGQSEERYRTLFESMQESFLLADVICDSQGKPVDARFVEVNPAFEALVQRPRGKIIGRTYRELFPAIEAEAWAVPLGQVAVNGAPAHLELFGEGTGRYYQVVANSPRPGRFAAILLDITERKRAEEDRERLLTQLQAVLDSITDGVIIADPQGNLRSINPAALQMHRYENDDQLPPHLNAYPAIYELFDGDKLLTPEQWPLARAVRGEAFSQLEIRLHRKDMDQTWFGSFSGSPVRNKSGEIILGVIAIRDVTEHRRAELERQQLTRDLAERVEELQAILDTAPVAIWIAHDPQCLRITGNAYADQVIMQIQRGGNISLSARPGDAAVSYKMLRDGIELPPADLPMQLATATGQPVSAQELQLVFPDGRIVELLISAVPLFDSEGRPRGAVAAGIDTTEIRNAEERLRQSQKMESIGLLAGGIAHDFNNLLVGVIGNASLARHMLSEEHAVARLLDGILNAGNQAAHLTQQMLAYAGKGRFVIEPVNLSALIPSVVELVQPAISKKITLQLDLDPSLSSIQADATQMRQVVTNILINAAEAIGNQGGLIVVKTGVQRVDQRFLLRHPGVDLSPGEYVCLEVRDTGPGMDQETQARIFDPFFSTKFQGRGLGLAAVMGIVRGHKGAISVASTPGRGTAFTVLLPAVEGQPRPAAPVAANAADLRGSGTILVVDDELVVRDLARSALERYGYEVLVAESGSAALAVLRKNQHRISLVLLDLSMPGMSGEETLPELRSLRPDIKVMVSSGYTEAETMALFSGQPLSGFIQKPYTIEGLAEKVKTALR